MFNLRDNANALRVCGLAVLLHMPLTTQALPYDDNHVALDDQPTAGVPAEREECRPSAYPNRWADSVGDQCLRDCDSWFMNCKVGCRGDVWCEISCATTHAFCFYTCNAATRG